jgi:hypothetical protein
MKDKILNFLKNMKLTLILLLTIIILFFLLFMQCDRNTKLKTQYNISNNNIKALNDSVRIIKNKAGELQYEKYVLIAEKNNLKLLNENLNNEVKKQKNSVIYISTAYANLKTKIDELSTENSSLKDSLSLTLNKNGDTIYNINWNFDKKFDNNNFRVIEGKTKLKYSNKNIYSLGSDLTKFDMGINLVTGLEEKNGQISIFIKSDYPDLTFSKIDGALVDVNKSEVLKKLMKQPKFIIGPQVGFGTVISNSGLQPTFYIGIGLTYKFFGF